MIEIARTIDTLRDQLNKAIQLAIADLTASLEKARDSEQSLDREYLRQEQEQMRLDDLKVEYRSLEDQTTVAKNAYTQVLDSLNKTTTSKGLDYRIPVSLLDRAVPSSTPYTPNNAHIIRTCLLVGLAVFFCVAFGLSMVDDRIKSSWDVESFIGVPLLGIIPNLSHVDDDDKHQLAIRSKATPGVEAFLSVYSAVKVQSKLDYPKTMLVTSTIPGEGKTLVSCNLAGCFARHGRTTLLVDCDMRRPMLHRHFKLPNDAGILAWTEAGASLEGDLLANPELGITPITENLWLLRSGGRSKSPTEFLEQPIFGQLIDRLKKRFELIVIDSPPVGAVSDSLLIAERTDEVIYVCRFNRAARKHIKQFVRALRDGKNEFLGIVLNGLSPRRIEYYTNYRYYRSYKKYYGAQT
jgi:capsular exopolysaccharide synthesis family protein